MAPAYRRPPPVAWGGGSWTRTWTEREFLALLQSADFTLIDSRPVNFGQFRFMDKALWPERVDVWFTQLLEQMARVGLLGPLGRLARTHVCPVRRAST